MKNKKAFLRTVEAVIAVILTFLLLVILFPQKGISEFKTDNLKNINIIQYDPDLRGCIYSDNLTCVENIIPNYIPNSYDYDYLLSTNPNDFIYNLPKEQIYTKTLVFAGYNQIYDFRVLKIYYWLKNN